jgi:hypothetical protein
MNASANEEDDLATGDNLEVQSALDWFRQRYLCLYLIFKIQLTPVTPRLSNTDRPPSDDSERVRTLGRAAANLER